MATGAEKDGWKPPVVEVPEGLGLTVFDMYTGLLLTNPRYSEYGQFTENQRVGRELGTLTVFRRSDQIKDPSFPLAVAALKTTTGSGSSHELFQLFEGYDILQRTLVESADPDIIVFFAQAQLPLDILALDHNGTDLARINTELMTVWSYNDLGDVEAA